MDEYQREDLIKKVELKEGHRLQMLGDLGIPRSTYYKWRRTYDEDGLPGLAKTKPQAKRVWNRLEDKEIETLEINLSCPNIKMKKMFSQNSELTYNLVKSLRALTRKTLIVKITPEVDDVVEIAKAASDAGADALSLVNTFFALSINIETKKPFLGSIYGGYSSRAIKPLALYKVWQVYKNVDIPIIGGGGIENTNDAIEFFLAGATAISIGTINLVYPNRATDIVKGLKDYMKRKKINDINKLRGGMVS